MDNLRLVLLLIACLLVLGIYLWDIFFRREARGGDDMLEAVDDLPEPGADQQDHAPAAGRAADRPTGDGPRDHGANEGLLILHIVSPDETGFNGVSIQEAATGAGMVFGRMDIFHHFGSDAPQAAEPWFSMANMYEPGAFDQSAMAELQTRGVVVFMYPPSAPEPGAVFDLFLDATRRMARALGGEILTAERAPLTLAAATALRAGVVSAPGKSAD